MGDSAILYAVWNDNTGPVCSITFDESISISDSGNVYITCNDEKSFSDSEILSSDLSFDITGIASCEVEINSIEKSEISLGYKYNVFISKSFCAKNTINLTLNNGVVSDVHGNVNEMVNIELPTGGTEPA